MFKHEQTENSKINKKIKEVKLLTNYIPVKKANAHSNISEYETESSIQKNFSNKVQKNKNHIAPFQSYFIKKANENIQNKLNQIRWKPIKPKINEIFLSKETKIQEFRQQHKNLFIKKE